MLPLEKSSDADEKLALGAYNILNPLWVFSLGWELNWHWIDSQGRPTNLSRVIVDEYLQDAESQILLDAPGDMGETIEGLIEIRDANGDVVAPPAGKPPVTYPVTMIRSSDDPSSPEYNQYTEQGNHRFVLTTLDAVTIASMLPPGVIALYDPGTQKCIKIDPDTKAEQQAAGNTVKDNEDCANAYKAKIVFPDLNADGNKISQSAVMPDLELKVEAELPIKENTEARYSWRVRTQYLSATPNAASARKSNGCDIPASGDGRPSDGKPNAWGLKDTDKFCADNLTTIDPLDDINSNSASLKLGTYLSSSSTRQHLFGGGQMEVAVDVEFTDNEGEQVKFRLTSDLAENKRILGLNPTRDQIKTESTKLTNALSISDGNIKDSLPATIDGILCRETGAKHIGGGRDVPPGNEETIAGYPIIDSRGGYGLTQLTVPHPTYREKWGWKANLKNTVNGRIKAEITADSQEYDLLKVLAGLSASFGDNDKKKVVYRHLVGLHNASSVGYMDKPDGIVTTGSDYERIPVVCHEPRQTSLLPGENSIYGDNLQSSQAKYGPGQAKSIQNLLQDFATEVTSDPLCESKPEGQRKRKFRGSPTGTINGISTCGSEGTTLTESMRSAIVSFADIEISDNVDCSGGDLVSTAGRRIGVTGSGESLELQARQRGRSGLPS